MFSFVYIIFSYTLLRVGCMPSGLRIVSNVTPAEDEYPFIVRLERRIVLKYNNTIAAENNVHICTCAVLSRSLSLTAGHCLNSVGSITNLTNSLTVQTVVRYGAGGGNIAKVVSVIHHPSFYEPGSVMRSNIGLVRTELIELKQYARLSALEIVDLQNRVITLVGYKTIKNSVRIGASGAFKPSQLQLLHVVAMPHVNQSELKFSTECASIHCLPTSTTCPGDSGGPLLHSTGIIGVSTISLESIQVCSELNNTQLFRMEDIIVLTKPHVQWINDSMTRDEWISDIN
ncbi:hypothetical protein HF086_008693 [Spodoptera exigua]|uniref:Peptidase S1 domain-containing protein n=1 Tax=Spodoptera exigua TaxID=7107 RepID=A0A922MWM0_SPOEX|nr:hypothetical protein HF086_008693 [Spodoptera exigua]